MNYSLSYKIRLFICFSVIAFLLVLIIGLRIPNGLRQFLEPVLIFSLVLSYAFSCLVYLIRSRGNRHKSSEKVEPLKGINFNIRRYIVISIVLPLLMIVISLTLYLLSGGEKFFYLIFSGGYVIGFLLDIAKSGGQDWHPYMESWGAVTLLSLITYFLGAYILEIFFSVIEKKQWSKR